MCWPMLLTKTSWSEASAECAWLPGWLALGPASQKWSLPRRFPVASIGQRWKPFWREKMLTKKGLGSWDVKMVNSLKKKCMITFCPWGTFHPPPLTPPAPPPPVFPPNRVAYRNFPFPSIHDGFYPSPAPVCLAGIFSTWLNPCCGGGGLQALLHRA